MIGIIGHGFVGSSVANAFDAADVIISDPKLNSISVEDVVNSDPLCIFVCVPTPMGQDGKVNPKIVQSVLKKIPEKMLTIVKSTITPNNLPIGKKGLVLNPEFLTEKNAKDDFLHPPFHVFGGAIEDTRMAEAIFHLEGCKVDRVKAYHTDIKTASFVKYSINTFLATKVIYMNQLKELYLANGGKAWESLTEILASESRFGSSHMKVPNDGQYGFGGTCFPKDTSAFYEFGLENNIVLSVLESAIKENKKLRPEYY